MKQQGRRLTENKFCVHLTSGCVPKQHCKQAKGFSRQGSFNATNILWMRNSLKQLHTRIPLTTDEISLFYFRSSLGIDEIWSLHKAFPFSFRIFLRL